MQISNIPEELLYPLCGCRALQFKGDKTEISSHLLINTLQLSFDMVELIPTAEFKYMFMSSPEIFNHITTLHIKV